MSNPLISVITPTWQRHDLLYKAIRCLNEQLYDSLEHIIVSDGQDAELELLLQTNDITKWPTYLYHLGHNWTGKLTAAHAAAPLLTGQLLAHGTYQIFMADDELFDIDHISSLYELLVKEGVDFTYSKCEVFWKYREGKRIIGEYPPRPGQITNFLYPISLLDKGLYRVGIGREGDWDLIERWLDRGATCAMLDRVTMGHRADD